MTEQDPNGNESLVGIPWVAQRLGVSERYVRRLVAERRLRHIKFGRPIRFDPGDVERFIDESRRPPAS